MSSLADKEKAGDAKQNVEKDDNDATSGATGSYCSDRKEKKKKKKKKKKDKKKFMSKSVSGSARRIQELAEAGLDPPPATGCTKR